MFKRSTVEVEKVPQYNSIVLKDEVIGATFDSTHPTNDTKLFNEVAKCKEPQIFLQVGCDSGQYCKSTSDGVNSPSIKDLEPVNLVGKTISLGGMGRLFSPVSNW